MYIHNCLSVNYKKLAGRVAGGTLRNLQTRSGFLLGPAPVRGEGAEPKRKVILRCASQPHGVSAKIPGDKKKLFDLTGVAELKCELHIH